MQRCAPEIRLASLLVLLIVGVPAAQANIEPAYQSMSQSGGTVLSQQTLYLEVFINGVSTELIGEFQASRTGFYSTPKELEELGLLLKDPPVNADGLVSLDGVDGLSYAFDPQKQVLRLFVADELRVPQLFDASRKSAAAWSTPESDWGAVLNYSLLGNFRDDDFGNLADYSGLAGTFDARMFSDLGVFRSGLVARSGTIGNEADLVRLDTAWRHEDPESLVTYEAGDFISSGLNWTRPVRLAGFQASRNFGLRPDLITTPISTVYGSAAVPSTVDVYVNSARAYSKDVQSGPFEVASIPVSSGPSTVRVVVRDALGRETVTTADTYVSPMLLAPNLLDFSIGAGYPRRSYGIASNDYYTDPFVTGSVRYGVSEQLTLEGHTEIGAELLNGGLGLAFSLAPAGVASVSMATSHLDPQDCPSSATACEEQIGFQLGGSIELAFEDWRIYARTLRRFDNYADIATVTATDAFDRLAFYPNRFVPTKTVDQVSLSLPTGLDRSFVHLNFTHTVNEAEERHRVVGLSYSRAAFWNGTFTLSAYQDIDDPDIVGAFAGLSFSFADNIHASTGLAGKRDDLAVSADIVRPQTSETGTYGWRLRTREGVSAQHSATVSYRAEVARLEAGVDERAGRAQLHAQADGAVAVLNGNVFLTDRIDDAFAVVDVGTPDIEVFSENRPVGITNGDGKLLVPSLRSWEPNSLSIDPTNLPINADIGQTKQTVRPAGQRGVFVKFETQAAADPALISFQSANGVDLPVGSEGSLNGGTEQFLVGYDGQAYIRALGAENTVTIIQPDGTTCTAHFSFTPQPDKQVYIENVSCL